MAGLALLQMDTQTLLNYPLPASRILIVENKQSGYALPALDDTIAVFGGGRNTTWLQASWLQGKHIGYWGDIDSWGLAILSEVRMRQGHVQALMMDEVTLLQHRTRMVNEDSSLTKIPDGLTLEELRLFERLCHGDYGKNRLEQERLAPDYVLNALMLWRAQLME